MRIISSDYAIRRVITQLIFVNGPAWPGEASCSRGRSAAIDLDQQNQWEFERDTSIFLDDRGTISAVSAVYIRSTPGESLDLYSTK